MNIPAELLPLFNKNTQETKVKILSLITDFPSETDGVGFVYAFKSDEDNNTKNNFYMKLGRTTRRNPEQRVLEQNGNMFFCQKSSFNKKFERFVHLFFRYAREIRVFNNKNEIEWFHFTTNINVYKYVALIHEFVEDIYEPYKVVDKRVKVSKYVSQTYKFDDIYEPYKVVDKKVNRYVPKVLKSDNSDLININTASLRELATLDGIAYKLAKRIVDYRETYGDFECISDVMRVPYIKEIRFAKMKHQITV